MNQIPYSKWQIQEYEKLISYYKKQMGYYACLLQAITDVGDADIIKKIVDRHFDLMKKKDEGKNE